MSRSSSLSERDSSYHTTTGKPATLYDAVAGRVGYESLLSEQRPSKNRDTARTIDAAVPPGEVLFRRKDAPLRFAEDDVYEADRHLKLDQSLPDSDLLKAIHAYVADYYDRTSNIEALDVRSMDETALLAFGILLEEAAAEALGETGDLAFVEQDDEYSSERVSHDIYWQNGRPCRSVLAPSHARRGSQHDIPMRQAKPSPD